MKTTDIIILFLYVAWNMAVFILYGVDKHNAKHRKWRISENVLILSAVLMGGVGALTGMKVLRHKTRKLKFTFGVPLAIVFNIVAAVAIQCMIN